MTSRILLSALALATIASFGCNPEPGEGIISCNPRTFRLNDGQCPADWEDCRLAGTDADDGLCYRDTAGADAGMDTGTPADDVGLSDASDARSDTLTPPMDAAVDAAIDALMMGDVGQCDGDMLIGTACTTATTSCEIARYRCVGGVRACVTEPAPSATVCREAAVGTACDVAESCDGSSRACPADGFASSGVTCRASEGDCDVAEACSGTSADCPADVLRNAATECRGVSGACDVAERCTGSSATCPVDLVASIGSMCAGGFCNGMDRTCAAGCVAGGACSPSGTSCEVGIVSCATGTPVCVSLSPGNPGRVCRPSAGPCDSSESCDGSSATCPTDGFLAAGVICDDSSGATCDRADVCSGSSAACPQRVVAAGMTCREAALGGCDSAEVCDGIAPSCPADGYQPSSTVCRAAAPGVCDVAEMCSGSSATCPADAFAPASTICRGSTGGCDPAEMCSGSAATCPADALLPTGMTCRPAVPATCDIAESCTGTAICPADGFQPATAACPTPCTLTCSGTSQMCVPLPPNTLYVSPTGTADGLSPCNPTSISGLNGATGTLSGWTIRFAAGSYSTPIVLTHSRFAGITIQGGYTSDFRARPGALRTAPMPNRTRLIVDATHAVTVGQTMTISGLDIGTTNASAPGAYRATVFVNAGTLTLTESSLVAGNGVGGVNGADPIRMVATGGSAGLFGADGTATAGGAGGGGLGGNGGYPMVPGSGGTSGYGFDGVPITGTCGTSGLGGGSATCGAMLPPNPGSMGVGCGGLSPGDAAGVGGDGLVTASGWAPRVPLAGGPGADGRPGPNGGGGGCRVCSGDSGGGGGGQGGQGGIGGLGGNFGTSGGASIGILVWHANVTLTNVSITVGAGGQGGGSGRAQMGGPGGMGGAGGTGFAGAPNGGNGGNGGAGGNGGCGGAGGGGPEVGIFREAPSTITIGAGVSFILPPSAAMPAPMAMNCSATSVGRPGVRAEQYP